MNRIELSPGIKEPLCGYQWVWQHQHDLDGWTPTVEFISPGYKQTMTVKDPAIFEDIIKANKP